MVVLAQRDAARRRAKERQEPVEVVATRTARSTEIVNPDGSRSVRLYEQVAFVSDGSGGMRPLDGTLDRRPDGRLMPRASEVGVSFAPVASGREELARLDLSGGSSVGFGLEGAATVAAATAGEVATYANIANDVDLELTATATSAKDVLVLRSPTASRSFRFPLKLNGEITPKLDSGRVLFVNRYKRVVATIPPGFMEDSSVDPRSGGPATSPGVKYTLLSEGGSWILRVDLDSAWIDDPSRVWPIRVDPELTIGGTDDTFVSSRDYANTDNSGKSELLIGTYNSGAEKSASYLRFDGALDSLSGKHITGASLHMWNTWSWSCNPAPASVHAVTQAWSGPSTISWPGPTYEATPLATSTFAHGYSACPTEGWATWALPTSRVQAWANGSETFRGLTLRASTTSSTGWKRFWSSNYANTSKRPYLQITYVQAPPGVAAVQPAPNGTVHTLTPTLWADYVDPEPTGTSLFMFRICAGSPEPTCVETPEWQTSPTYTVPSDILQWAKPAVWQVNVSNGIVESGWLDPWWFTPEVPQPPITAHLAGSSQSTELPGINPQVGNWSTTATDINVNVTGPPLSITRTYNSQDHRTDGAFGPGWTTPLDQRVRLSRCRPLADSRHGVDVMLSTGRTVRFGVDSSETGIVGPAGGEVWYSACGFLED